MTVLCFDFGLKRIGVAAGNDESGIAFAVQTLKNSADLYQQIEKLVNHYQAGLFLVGNPLKSDNAPGDIQQQLDVFMNRLRRDFSLPVEIINERYSSKLASQKLRVVNIRSKQQKPLIDAIAAQTLLQEWLDNKK